MIEATKMTLDKNLLEEISYSAEGDTISGITLIDRYAGSTGRWTQRWHDVVVVQGFEGYWMAEWEQGLTEYQETHPYEWWEDQVDLTRVYPHEEVITKTVWRETP